MPSMKRIARFLTVASYLVCVNALSQAKQEKPVETNVCDIANNPVQFEGKLVQVRSQIWPDAVAMNGYWLNGSTTFLGEEAENLPFYTCCFIRLNGLWGHTFSALSLGKLSGTIRPSIHFTIGDPVGAPR